jgi:hypothetical protein
MQLARVGLSGQLSVGGLASHVFLETMKQVRSGLEVRPLEEDVDRLAAWVRGDNGQSHFSAYRHTFAETLLLPWVQKDPSVGLRDKIQNYVLELLGDPRIDSNAWVRCDDLARAVIVRWLAKATLEQFFKVVDRVAPKQQWEYRRAFWTAYIEKRVVRNSWVAFGSEGAEVATRIAETAQDKLMRQFATLKGAAPNQAVLLLEIEDLIVADWSHNGRLRIWRTGNPSAPKFRVPSYIATQLRGGADYETVHLPPDGWQAGAESYVRRLTGVRLWKPNICHNDQGHSDGTEVLRSRVLL